MRSKHYVKQQDFHDALVEYKNTKSNEAYQKLGIMFYNIASRYLNNAKSIGKSKEEKDDLISDSVFIALKKINRFKIDKDNPFAYFTQIIKNAMNQSHNKTSLYNSRNFKISYIENVDTQDALG